MAFRLNNNTTPEIIEQLQKHSAKSVSLGNALAYKKSKLCLTSILYKKNINEECLKLMHVTFYRCFDRLLGS